MLGFVSLRGLLSDRHPLHSLWRRIAPLLIGRGQTDRQAIATHYDFSSEFYLKFMDPTRCYSHALFERDDETLETAQRRKLDFAIDACRLRPGDRVLDVGGGWGSFTEHAGRRGIQVTSLTISAQQERYVTDLIRRLQLPCRILNQDFLDYTAPAPYDAIVILGVMEHLPDYPAVLRQCQRLLKPGGRVYLDASAFREEVLQAHLRLPLYLSGRPFLFLPARVPCGGSQITDGGAGGSQRPPQLLAHVHCLGREAGGCAR